MVRKVAVLLLFAFYFSCAGLSIAEDLLIERLGEMQTIFTTLPDEYGFSSAMIVESREKGFFCTSNYTKSNILAIEEKLPDIDLYILTKANPLNHEYMLDGWGIDEVWYISPDDVETIGANNEVLDYLDQIGPSKHGGYEWIQMMGQKEVLVVYLLEGSEQIRQVIQSNRNARIVIGNADYCLSDLEKTCSEIMERSREFAITDAIIDLSSNAVTIHTSRYTKEVIHAIREAFSEFDRYVVMDEEGLP